MKIRGSGQPETPGVLNALSFDVEEYFHTHAFSRIAPEEEWNGFPSRVAENTEKTLAILRGFRTRATFFVMGWIAERNPGLMARIAQEGHEIAAHGYRHRLVYNQRPEEFRQDIKKAKKLLEELTHQEVIGYRAPTYSLGTQTPWAFDILREEGYNYDSSIFPITHDLYGLPGAPRFPYLIEAADTKKGKLREFPPSTIRVFRKNFPFSGGAHLRILPGGLIIRAVQKINAEGQPALIYLHTWELDPHRPRYNLGWWYSRRHYFSFGSTETKLKKLLAGFRFAPLREVLAERFGEKADENGNA